MDKFSLCIVCCFAECISSGIGLFLVNEFSLCIVCCLAECFHCILCCFADFFELISKAQGKRMDDQRGELRGNLELPDFLKIPNSKPVQSGDMFKVPYAPPPPPGFRNTETNFKKPVVKKTMSTPLIQMPEKIDLMQELTAKLSKRTDATKSSSSTSREKADRNAEQNEMLLDYNFNSRPQPPQEQNRSHSGVVSAEGRHLRRARPRSSTDAAVYTVDAAQGMRVETGHRPQPLAEVEPRKNVAHVHPSVRSQASQPVTVNSLRGIHYATNPRRNIADQATYYRPNPNNVGSVKPQTIARMTSKSSHNVRETAPAIYDVKPGSIREAMGVKISEDSMKYSSAPVVIPSRKMVSAYSLPEVNTKKAEVLVPAEGGPPPVPRRTVSSTDNRRPRPKPITDPEELLAGLESTPVEPRLSSSSPERVASPPNPDMMRVGSPLPPPPTPPSGSLHDLRIADFSPPPSICESPEKRHRPPEYRLSLDSSRFPQTSASQSDSFQSNTTCHVRTSSASPPNYTGPVGYVNMPSKDAQRQRIDDNRSTNHNKQPITTHVRGSNSHVPNLTNSIPRGRGEDRMDTASQPVRPVDVHTPGSVTPTVSNANKTVTPPSTNERTLVEESPSENATPYTGHRPSVDTAAKRLINNTASVPKSRNMDPEKRRSRQDSEIPKLDPYVTYENDDLRVTFV